ncbi:MAG: hypothetical protein AVDCRST_MAG49-1035, partial [uncultured Thermomicrobiales bacterium]
AGVRASRCRAARGCARDRPDRGAADARRPARRRRPARDGHGQLWARHAAARPGPADRGGRGPVRARPPALHAGRDARDAAGDHRRDPLGLRRLRARQHRPARL